MKSYRMVWEPWTTGLPWEYSFEAPSDKFARDYAQRHVETSPGFHAEAVAMQVWRLSDPSDPRRELDAELIARFVLDKAPVRNTLEAKP